MSGTGHAYRVGWWRLIATLAISLAGCSDHAGESSLNKVATGDEVATTHLAVTYIEAWDQVAPSLTPNFSNTGDAALTQVIPNSANVANSLLDAIGAQLQFQLKGAGAPSNVPLPSGSTTAQSLLLGQGILNNPTAKDPILQYSEANDLFQEIALLNRAMQAPALAAHYKAYLVSLQLTLMPYQRNEPYDGVADISFFTVQKPDYDEYFRSPIDQTSSETKDEKSNRLKLRTDQTNNETKDEKSNRLKPPLVIPLLVTDDLQGTATSNTTDVVRQLNLAVTALFKAGQGNAGLDALRDKLDSITASSLNGLQTVARYNDNTIRVRLGATQSPVAGNAFVMVSHSHYITVLLMVPVEWIKQLLEAPKTAEAKTAEAKTAKAWRPRPALRVISQTTFFDTTDGRRLEPYDKEKEDKRLEEKFDEYLDKDVYSSNGGLVHSGIEKAKTKFLRIYSELFDIEMLKTGFSTCFGTNESTSASSSCPDLTTFNSQAGEKFCPKIPTGSPWFPTENVVDQKKTLFAISLRSCCRQQSGMLYLDS